MNQYKFPIPSHPVGLLFIGLLMAQIIATVQVYLSNLDLYATVAASNAAGYLTVPNQKIMGSLQNFAPAFFGGLFFTLTVGAGIALCSLAAAWLWVRVFLRNRFILIFFLFLWLFVLVLVNSDGINPMPALYLSALPPILFSLCARRESWKESPAGRIRLLVHLIPIPLLAILWFTQFDRQMFLDLRDNLLLSNAWGRKFSNFYYAYTLYPAEAFKALNQKTIKTYGLEDIQNQAVARSIENRLTANGWLLLTDPDTVDLKIIQKGDSLELTDNNRTILQIPLSEFLKESEEWLLKFAQQIDRNGPFRRLTFLSLLFGFPISIYLFLHAVLYYLFLVIIGRNPAALTASVGCLLIGILVLVYFQSNRSANIEIHDMAQALESENWQTRVAALKMIHQKKLEITGYKAYPELLESRIPQERYWLARTLAYSRRTRSYADLLTFLNDQNTNIQTMALYALGQRRNPRAIEPILEKIQNSSNWYSQMYAYNALRSLGWKQTKSP